MPFSEPFQPQLITSKLLTPADVKLPMDIPWPVPKRQLVTRMSCMNAVVPPIAIWSSPSLIKLLTISTFVPAKSMPSVFGDPSGVLIVRLVTRTFPLGCEPEEVLIFKCVLGGFWKVTLQTSTVLQPKG